MKSNLGLLQIVTGSRKHVGKKRRIAVRKSLVAEQVKRTRKIWESRVIRRGKDKLKKS